MKFFFSLIALISTLSFSQTYMALPEAIKTLPYDVRSSSGAAIISYNFDASMLMCGNSNLPSFTAVSESIKTFLIEEGITISALITASPDESLESSYVTELLNEKEPSFLIAFNIFSVPNASVMTREKTLECGPEMEVGLFCSVQIAPYSKSETMYMEKNPVYHIYKGSLTNLLSTLKEDMSEFKKQDDGKIEHEEVLYKFGKINYGLPANFSEEVLYIPLPEQIVVVGKPQGMLNKYVAKGFKTTNKMILKSNQDTRELCAGYNFNFEFVSQTNAEFFEKESGYILKVAACYTPISKLFENQNLLGASEKTDLALMAKFPCKWIPTGPDNNCSYMQPNPYYYHYLKDLKTGDIYLLNYEGYSGDEPVPNSLKLFLDAISKE